MATDESFLGPARMPFFDGAESVYIDGQEVQSIVITETGAILFEKGGEVVENSLKLLTKYAVIHDDSKLLFHIVNSNSIYDTDTGELNIVDIDLSLNAQTINAFYGDPTNSSIPITNGFGSMQISDTSNPIHYIFQNEENNIYQEVFFSPWVSEENKVTDILKTFEIVYTGSNFSSSGTPYEGEKIYAEFDGRYANFYPTDSNVSFGYTSAQGEHRVTMYNVTGLNKNSYYNTYSSMKFYLYEGIQTLYEECFASSDITEIDIPTSVSTMGNKIFANCTQLTSITLNWTEANNIIAYNSTWTQGISTPPIFTVPTGTKQLYIDKGYPSAQVYEEPLKFTFSGTTLTQYSSGSFSGTNMMIDYGDGTIESTTGKFGHTYSEDGTYQVKIYGVSRLENFCFYNCIGLTSITIPDNITGIASSCFYRCTDLTSVKLSSSIRNLENYCFKECVGLTSITIPDGVTNLRASCFSGCTGLTSITIPDGVTNLGKNCFQGCTSLTSIIIPDGVTNLGDSCFNNCTGLTSINIPSSVTSLGVACFLNCSSLNDYHLNWTSSSTIIAYDSDKMPNNTNTIFHIPYGTTQLYIDKGYPASKLDEPVSYTDCAFTERNNKSILSKEDGDIAYLDAQLTDSGGNPVAVSGVGIDFYQDNTLLDTVQTDSTGKATYSYTSQGVGDTVFSVGLTISGNYVSKTYSIEDFIKTFKLDGTDNYRTFRSSSKSFNNGVMTAKSCVAYGFENLNSFRLEFEWLGGYGIIMPSNVTRIDKNWIQIWSTGGYVYINGSRNNLPTFSEPFVPMDDGFYKVILEKDNGTYRFKVEDTVICEFTNVPSATEWAVGIDHYSTSNNKIRNIKVKPLY